MTLVAKNVFGHISASIPSVEWDHDILSDVTMEGKVVIGGNYVCIGLQETIGK